MACTGCKDTVDSSCVPYNYMGIPCIEYDSTASVAEIIYKLGVKVCNFYDLVDNIPTPPTGDFEITESYPYIGYYDDELTYNFDISDIIYTGEFWVIVDNNYEYIGEPSDEAELLSMLNNDLGLGVWSIDGSTLTVIGYHTYGIMIAPSESDVISDLQLIVDSTDPVEMINIYGGSAYDISIERTIIGETDLIDSITDLNWRFLVFPSGAPVNWFHYVLSGGDGYNGIESDATLRGKDYTTVLGGSLYNGGVPYGYDFYDDFIHLVNETGVQEVVLGINIAVPLIPYSGTTIDWANVPLDTLIDEIDIMITKIGTTSASVKIVELGMELKTSTNADLFVNTGGIENTKAEIIAKLLTHTNSTSAVSILTHIETELPGTIISIDSKLWDDGTSGDSDFVPVLSALSQVTAVRQYYQFDDAHASTYAAARTRVAQRTEFWDFVNDADFNGKDVFLSQLEVKASSPIRNTVSNGLLMAEMFMVMSEDNLSNSNKLVGMAHMNIKQLFDPNSVPEYEHKTHYPFVKLIGEFYDNSQELISISGNYSIINTNLVMQAIKVGSELRLLILNPTGVEIDISNLNIDTVNITTSEFTCTQLYCDDVTDPLTQDFTQSTSTDLLIRPYSLSLIIIP
jgi:hypothetical protein